MERFRSSSLSLVVLWSFESFSFLQTWIHTVVLVLSCTSYFGFVLLLSGFCVTCSPPVNPLGIELLQMSHSLFYITCVLTTVAALLPRYAHTHTHTHCKNSCTGSVFPLGALHNSLIIKSFTLMTPGGANVVITDTAIHWICFVTPVVSIFQLNNVSEWTQTQDSQAGWGCLLWRQDEQDMRRLADWMHTDRGEHKKTGRTWKINRDKVQTENTESPAQETWHHFHC